MRVLVFGASITQGFWDSEGGWVNRLRMQYDKKQLSDIKNNDEPTIFNLGVSGDTTKNILNRVENEAEARNRYGDLAFVFSVGTNNAADGENRTPSSTSEYTQDLKEIVKKARKHSDKILFVGLPPCYEERTTPVFWRNIYYTNERIFNIDDAMRDFCLEEGIPYVRVRDAFSGRESELFADGLHPNDEGHQIIAKLVMPELDKLLNS